MIQKQFLPEHIFVSKPLSILLLILHISGLIYFCIQWLHISSIQANGRSIFLYQRTTTTRTTTKVSSSSSTPITDQQPLPPLSPVYIIATLFTSNFIGICFARTLHYQFYSWYFHAIPFLLWYHTIPTSTTTTGDKNFVYPIIIRLLFMMGIEYAFITFPATPISSAILQISHIAILIQIRPPNIFVPMKQHNDDDTTRDNVDHRVKID